ncbi:MAG: dihydroorotate dehydrogenase [Vezdaea acicularis]|nr:MAG: dihydroorotate dehydrogenase [Vezdaea acicularis]
MVPKLRFQPPILNSASLWATTVEELRALYECDFTGAVTTRTCTLGGFNHNENVRQQAFFAPDTTEEVVKGDPGAANCSSLNSLGYSPYKLDYYLNAAKSLLQDRTLGVGRKPFIISVTGSAVEVALSYRKIFRLAKNLPKKCVVLMEVNLSCPNIPQKPPPAYSTQHLREYITNINTMLSSLEPPSENLVRVGLKLPPYTYETQFDDLIKGLFPDAALNLPFADVKAPAKPRSNTPIAFLTAINTLGSSMVVSVENDESFRLIPSADLTGICGLGGVSIHPLALGNVNTLRRKLNARPELKHITIIGVGGVYDSCGYARMISVGADAVGVATVLGARGVDVFENLLTHYDDDGELYEIPLISEKCPEIDTTLRWRRDDGSSQELIKKTFKFTGFPGMTDEL